ncbi:MAG: cation-translocating P-type ATPase [Verrucomicrobiota bacterium]
MIDEPHAASPAEVEGALESDLEQGLSSEEAGRRLELYGPNAPERQRRPPYLRLALNQLVDPLVLLLVAAAVVSVAIGDTVEGIAIAAILVLNGLLGFWQEAGAERAILALSQAFTKTALVIRGGVVTELPGDDVVPGDVLLVRAGDRVAADARLVDERALEVDESALTGESLPVAKRVEAVGAGTPLAERESMIFAGTAVTQGSARALVCGTGTRTEMGAIEVLAARAKAPPTPLTRRLARLARQMVALGISITIVLSALILLRGGAWDDAFLTSVAVAVAAVPEGLAAIVTAALAFGARAMAQRGALVRRLAAIETLGETTVICTDKTGTLTENEIRVAALRTVDGVDDRELLEAAVLASGADWAGERPVGDPIETGLALAAMERGVAPKELPERYDPLGEIPFTSDRKRMTRIYAAEGGRRLFMKGAPETVAALARSVPDELMETATSWAGEGLRVIAIATRTLDPRPEIGEEIERDVRLLGVIALHDPLRATAAAAVEESRTAGISVRMVTGDHPATAHTIGHALGLGADAILARATPADKLALVEELQRNGEVVAVTGDGVNDAPALRRADVGVAMGRGGTEAAREAAGIVLTDDDFATIVAAVAEGRRIGDNIRKFVAFLLSANFGEVLVFAVAISVGMGAPLAVIQILVVNLLTDGLPALALARDPASPETMRSPPRPGHELFDRRTWWGLLGIGVLVGIVTFAAFVIGRAFGDDTEQTMAFATLALAELGLVYGMRSTTAAAWQAPRNRWLDASVLASAAVVAVAVYLPGLRSAFAAVPLDPAAAAIVLALALVPLVAVELYKAYRRSRAPGGAPPRRPIAPREAPLSRTAG